MTADRTDPGLGRTWHDDRDCSPVTVNERFQVTFSAELERPDHGTYGYLEVLDPELRRQSLHTHDEEGCPYDAPRGSEDDG